jgi:hypothetical protein
MGLEGHRVEAAERALQVGPVAGLDQGQESRQSGYDALPGGAMVNAKPAKGTS